MKLLKIRFGGFKNIKNVEIDFAQNNPISLISANNYGKSNVLTGLNFISDFLLSRPSIRERMMCDVDYIPININNARDNFSVSLTFEYNDEIDTFIADYSFSFCWATQVVTQDGTIDGVDGHITSEKLVRKLIGNKQKYQTLISRHIENTSDRVTKTTALYKASESGRCSSKIGNLESNELIIDRLTIAEGLYYSDMVSELHNIKFYVENHLDAKFAFEVTPLRLKGIKPLDLINDNNQLPRTLWYLKQKEKSIYEKIRHECTQLFPDILDIHAERISVNVNFDENNFPKNAPYMLDDAVYVLMFKNPCINQEISFELVSDGVKRILLTLTNLELARINGYQLIAIEEPENSIHPKLLNEYMQMIHEYAQEFRIVFSSHSPYLISCIDDLSSIMIGLPNSNGLAEFGHIKDVKGFMRLLDQRHEKPGTAIFNLLCETEKDEPCKLTEYWG